MTAGSIAVPTVIPLRPPLSGRPKNSIDCNTKIELRTGLYLQSFELSPGYFFSKSHKLIFVKLSAFLKFFFITIVIIHPWNCVGHSNILSIFFYSINYNYCVTPMYGQTYILSILYNNQKPWQQLP